MAQKNGQGLPNVGETLRLNLAAGAASVLVAAVLVALKLWALGQTGALSVAASLADSGMDAMVSLAGLMAIVYAARPPDDDHHFGHTSIEDLTSLAQALFPPGSTSDPIPAATSPANARRSTRSELQRMSKAPVCFDTATADNLRAGKC